MWIDSSRKVLQSFFIGLNSHKNDFVRIRPHPSANSLLNFIAMINCRNNNGNIPLTSEFRVLLDRQDGFVEEVGYHFDDEPQPAVNADKTERNEEAEMRVDQVVKHRVNGIQSLVIRI